MMLLTLRGTPFLYYGEEIGMRNVAIPVERMQDPLARTLHPELCRDGERTPMCWAPGPGAGFTSGDAWLPAGPQPPGTDVESQRKDPGSLLCLYRDLLALRRASTALQRGSWRALDAPEGVLAYEREHAGQRARVALNFSDSAARVDLGAGAPRSGLHTRRGAALPARARLELGPAEGVVLID
jgi:alpha-glucosidase